MSIQLLGNAPVCQLESGHQKGGRYFCCFCNVDGNRSSDLTYTLNVKPEALGQKAEKVLKTGTGRKSAKELKTNYFESLLKADIIGELHEREVKII